jgi:phosphocarrier protein
MATACARLTNAIGLHARPSVQLTRAAKGFEAAIDVALAPDGPWIDAKSPVKIMRFKAAPDTILYFRAEGPDAEAAVAALAALVKARFGEPEHGHG